MLPPEPAPITSKLNFELIYSKKVIISILITDLTDTSTVTAHDYWSIFISSTAFIIMKEER